MSEGNLGTWYLSEQFNNHCDQHSLLPECQSAYRKHHSCETSLVKLVNDILWNMEKQLVTPIVILDLSIAFDTVDHDLLLGELATRFGIKGKALEWYSNYLKPRRFRVTIEEETSKPRLLDYSVPQGSIQGAFLFIAYTYTLDKVIDSSQLELNGFADDHSVRSSFKPSKLDHTTEHHNITIIEKSMQNTKVWIDQVCLKMNNSKTEFIYFGWPSQLDKCTTRKIDVNGEELTRLDHTRHLGAYLDQQLGFKLHIQTKSRAAILNVLRIKAARKYLTKSACNKLMVALVLSHLDYANSLLGGLPKASIAKLQRIQNITARVVLNKGKYDSATSCLEELHWLPIKYRIEYKIITLVHRSLHNATPPYLIRLVNYHIPKRKGLHSEEDTSKLEIPRTTKKTFAARSFSVLGPTLWNNLPSELCEITSYITFRKQLKTHLFKLAFNK